MKKYFGLKHYSEIYGKPLIRIFSSKKELLKYSKGISNFEVLNLSEKEVKRYAGHLIAWR